MHLGLLTLGFLLGMRHALETDHVAAVASLATRSRGIGDTVLQGAVWGLGHTLTLFLFGSVVLLMDAVMPERLANGLELAVGVMLIVLGLDVLRRVRRRHLHCHVHRHADGTLHWHAHAHAPDEAHGFLHHHEHAAAQRGFPVRALLVGLMHGMAGSAALILLTLQTVHSVWLGMLYMALFGIGSIAGMASLSVVIAIPLRLSANRLAGMHRLLQIAVGLATLAVGSMTLIEIGWLHGLAA